MIIIVNLFIHFHGFRWSFSFLVTPIIFVILDARDFFGPRSPEFKIDQLPVKHFFARHNYKSTPEEMSKLIRNEGMLVPSRAV